MAQSKNTTNFEGLLFQFMDSPDPMLSMLEWLCSRMMEAEVSSKIGADKAVETLEEGLEDALTFLAFPKLDARKVSSNNMLERLNKEIRRRTRVVGIFPNPDSYLRLVTVYLMEYSEEWSVTRGYLSEDSLKSLDKQAA